MMRKFNVTGICVPEMHYMADISEQIERIFKLVESKHYITINHGRQYGKTTALGMLENRLADDYICANISFQYSEEEMFTDEKGFCQGLLSRIHRALLKTHQEEAKLWLDNRITSIGELDDFITERCKDKKIVLIIDEADKADEASNNYPFITFLKMLRGKYLDRTSGRDYTFHSVILASIRDVRNLKPKVVPTGYYTPNAGEITVNIPYNIALDFDVDMSFSAKAIATMLVDYENDRHTGMNIDEIAQGIHFYTSGYPYLVSKVCLLIETELNRNWTMEGVREAVKIILDEKGVLLSDLTKKIEENQELSDILFDLTIGRIACFLSVDFPPAAMGVMFELIAKRASGWQIHNRIFEIHIANHFISKTVLNWSENNVAQKPATAVIHDNIFDMELCLTEFKRHYAEMYTGQDLKFLKDNGRLIFLTWLIPFINGAGFYHFEYEPRDYGKMDLVIDYLKQQFIIEMRIGYDDGRHEDAYKQFANNIESKNMDFGYLLTFDFSKKGDERFADNQWIDYNGKRIYDVTVRIGTDGYEK